MITRKMNDPSVPARPGQLPLQGSLYCTTGDMEMTKSAMITVCGRPNVGKSTLTNALVGEKIAIVSDKPQTTRNRITAIVNRGDTQFVLMDTPGFHKPRTRLGDYMVNVVKESVADVDCVLLRSV